MRISDWSSDVCSSDLMGELKDTLNVHLSSTCRGASTVQQVMGRNQVSLLLSLYAYQMLHSLRALMERVTQKGWSIRKVREQILKTAATVAVHARKIAVHIGQSGGKWWPSLLRSEEHTSELQSLMRISYAV